MMVVANDIDKGETEENEVDILRKNQSVRHVKGAEKVIAADIVDELGKHFKKENI